MSVTPTMYTYCSETGVLLQVRIKKPGHSRYQKIYDKADFELAGLRKTDFELGFRIEVIPNAPKN